MPKLQIEISKIKCNRTTGELSPDEIYAAFFFYKANQVSDTTPVSDPNTLQVAVSDVRSQVHKGDAWKPQRYVYSFDLGEAQLFGLQFFLFEQDDDEKRKALVALEQQLNSGLPPDSAEINKIFDTGLLDLLSNTAIPFKANTSTNGWDSNDWMSVVSKVVELIGKAFKYFRQDDMVGCEPFAYHLQDENLTLAKSFNFKRLFANYDVILNFSIIEDEKTVA